MVKAVSCARIRFSKFRSPHNFGLLFGLQAGCDPQSSIVLGKFHVSLVDEEMNDFDLAVWTSFKHVSEHFLGNQKSNTY